MSFFIKDKSGDNHEVTMSEFMHQAFGKRLPVNPVHNYDLLRKHRLGLYNKIIQKILKERSLNGLETTEEEKHAIYLTWIRNDIAICDAWLKRNSLADQLEISKYKTWLTAELNDPPVTNEQLVTVKNLRYEDLFISSDATQLSLNILIQTRMIDSNHKPIDLKYVTQFSAIVQVFFSANWIHKDFNPMDDFTKVGLIIAGYINFEKAMQPKAQIRNVNASPSYLKTIKLVGDAIIDGRQDSYQELKRLINRIRG